MAEETKPLTYKNLIDTFLDNFPEFQGFRKIARLSRDAIISEKIDGTNGLIYIDETGNIFAGSRNRWLWNSIEPEKMINNHGFGLWVKDNQEELKKLGKGYHYGEFWGKGIQRGYGLEEKRFSLFIGFFKYFQNNCCRVRIHENKNRHQRQRPGTVAG